MNWEPKTRNGVHVTWVAESIGFRFTIWTKDKNYYLNLREGGRHGTIRTIDSYKTLDEAKAKATAISLNGGLRKERIEYTVPDNVEIKKLPSGRAFGANDLRKWSSNVKARIYGPPIEETGRVRHIFCRKCSQVTKVRVNHKHIKVPPDFRCPGCGAKSARIAKHKERPCNSVKTRLIQLAR